MRAVLTSIPVMLLAACGHVYHPTAPRSEAGSLATVDAVRFSASLQPASRGLSVKSIEVAVALLTVEAVTVNALSLASSSSEPCGEGTRAGRITAVGTKRVLFMKTPAMHDVTLPHSPPPARQEWVVTFPAASSDGPPHAVDVVVERTSASSRECVRLPLLGDDEVVEWSERPRAFYSASVGLAVSSVRGQSTVVQSTGRAAFGRWLGPVRAGLEFGSPGPASGSLQYAAIADVMVQRWTRIGLATGVAYTFTPTGQGTHHGPRVGVRLDWLPAQLYWAGFRDHPRPSGLGVELLVSRLWGPSEAPDAWAFTLGPSGYLSW